MAFRAPRTRSSALTGGNTDGTSGPGVGAATMSVHDGGVGKMMFGVGVVIVFTGGVLGDVVQEQRVRSTKKEARSFFTLISRS